METKIYQRLHLEEVMKSTEKNVKVDYYKERVVAFVDILGFSDHVEETTKDFSKASNLHKALKSILSWQIENENNETFGLKDIGREITVFSDSIIISYSIDCQGGLFYILMDLIHLQIQLMSYDLLLRGGITIGKVYHDGKIAYGPAMIEAYELESKKAVYPRIIITEESLHKGIIKTLPYQNSLEEECQYVSKLVRRDLDGYYFLDILRQDFELVDSGGEYYLWLDLVRELIIEQVNRNKDKPHVLEKYNWLIRYFNEVVTDKSAFYPVPDESAREFRTSYRKLEIK